MLYQLQQIEYIVSTRFCGVASIGLAADRIVCGNVVLNLPATASKARTEMVAQTLDTKGLNCPLPILKAKKAIKGLQSGEVLEVLATDPGSVKDFEAFARATGNELLEHSEDAGVFRFLLKKTA